MKRLVLAAALSFAALPAFAQMDPRVAPQAVAVLQAQITYQEAIIRAKTEDETKLVAWWAEYVKGLATPAPVAKSE